MTKELLPDYVTIRDGGDDWHLECRFPDGQKYAAVLVDIENKKLAHLICDFLNTRAQPKYKRVDLHKEKIADPVIKDHMSYSKIYNEALDDIKSKYGDLYTMEGK